MPEGFTWEATADGTVTNVTPGAGEKAENAVTSFKIFKDGVDVTDQFASIDTSAKGTLTIEKRPIKLTANNASNEYTGSKITYATAEDAVDPYYTIEEGKDMGLAPGQSITAITLSGEGINAGSYPITIDKDSVAIGENTANYEITVVPGTLTITKAAADELGLSVTNYNAPYDGAAHTVSATTTVTEGTTISYSTDNTNWSTTAPTWTDVTEAQTVYVKAENPNYETATADGTVTITALAITVNDTATETYDGTKKTLTIAASKATGVLSGETLTLTGATISGIDQGEYTEVAAYTWSIAKADGSDSTGNYTITVTGKLTITAKPISSEDITVEAPEDVVYNGESQQQKPVVHDGTKVLVEGTDYTLTYSDDTTNVGTVTVTITGQGNYSGTVSVQYKITPASLKITVKDQKYTYNSKPHGEDNKTYTSDFDSKVTVEGLKGTDELTSIKLNGQETNAGVYVSKIQASDAVIGEATKNYTITYAPGQLTIDPKPVTITVNDANKVYGDEDPVFTGTVDGILNKGDLGTISYVRTNTEEDVGTYEEVLTATYKPNSNYTVTVVKGDFEITAKELTIHVKGAEMTVPYNGAEQKLGNSLQFTVVGELPNGVNVEQKAKVVQAAKGTNVGTYDQNLTVENLVVKGEAASNYDATIIVDSKGGLTIPKRPVTFTGETAARQYTGNEIELTGVTVSSGENTGLVNGHTHNVTYSAKGTEVGSYPGTITAKGSVKITAGGTDVTENYDITTTPGTLTVTPKPYRVTYVFAWPGGGAAPAGAPTPPAAVTVNRGANYTVSTEDYDEYNIPYGIAPNGNVITVLRFQGWDRTGTINNIRSDVTITGTWTIQMVWYTVTYTDGVPGQVIFPDQVTTTLRIGANTPAFNGTPTREGYTFTGWAPAVSPTVTGNNVYTAQWAPIEEERTVEPTPEPTPVVEEEIIDEEVPQAAPAAAWALINLLAALGTVATAVGMIITFFKKKDDDDDGTKANPDEENDENKGKKSKFLGLIPAVASVVIFILTENMHNPMALVDKWTIPMVLILAANGIVAYLTRNKKPEDEDTEKAAG